MSTLAEDMLALRELKRDRDEKKGVADAAERKFKAAQAQCMERAEAEGVESIRLDGTLFVPTETIYGKVNDRPTFVAWALENEPELVEHREIKERINELVREKIENGEDMSDMGLTFYTREYISQRAG